MYKISRSWVDMLIFYVLLFRILYLASCQMDSTEQQQVRIRFCANLGQIATESLVVIRQARKHESFTSSTNSTRSKKVRHVKSKAKSMLMIFFDIKLSVHKHLFLAGQTVNSAYCCDILRRLREKVSKTLPRTLATKELAVASQQRTVSHVVDQKQHDCRPPLTLLLSVSMIEDKRERPPFRHNWGDRGRIAGGLNTHIEHDFQDTFKNSRSAENSAYAQKGTTSRLMVWPLGPRLYFDQMAEPVPEIMDSCL
jgi:hypothetical protein